MTQAQPALHLSHAIEDAFETEETREGWLRAYNLPTTTIQKAMLNLYRAKPPPFP